MLANKIVEILKGKAVNDSGGCVYRDWAAHDLHEFAAC